MSSVQRTTQAGQSTRPGWRTVAPWSSEQLPRRFRLAGYLLTIIAADVALAGWQLSHTQPAPRQLLLFAAFLGCAAACVEATRRSGVPPTGARELLSTWWLAAALLLPPAYVTAAPVAIAGLAHWRARQGPLYWRVFTAAALGLAGAVSSYLFHLARHSGHWPVRPLVVADAAACAGLFVLANAILVAIARRAAQPGLPWLSAAWDTESLLVDLAGLCAGMLVAVACALNAVLLVVALPPVILLQRSLLHQKLRTEARTDPKTGLLNAVAWQREAEAWIRRSRRAGAPAALLLVDIDHFKRVNDTYGHLAGDELLTATAHTLVQHVQAGDVLGRFGGEEFVIVAPGAGEQDACWMAERLREEVGSISVPARGELVTVTVSIGVAALGRDGYELFELLAAADAALYRAKKAGRDRVCTLPPGACPSDPWAGST